MPAFQLTRPIRLTLTGAATANADFTAGTSVPVANAFTLSGPVVGSTGLASTFTVTPNGQLASNVIVTPAATNAGSIAPTTLTFLSGSSDALTFTVTRAADGTSSISITNNGGLSNGGSPIIFTTATSTLAASFSLTSPSTGTQPFTIGHAFKQGEVASGVVVTGADAQVVPKNYWPDGSMKFAVISGTTSIAVANTPQLVALTSGSVTYPSSLTTTQLQTAMSGQTCSIGCGAFGTASWSGSDWLSPFQTWVSGHKMSSWTFRKAVGTDATLVAWIEVRLYDTGAVDVLPWIENGYLKVNPATNKNATYTFTLGSTQRFSQAINLLHHQRTPLVSGSALSYWIGTDPEITPKHDAAYFAATGMVPAFISAAQFAGEFPLYPADPYGLRTTFTPLEAGDYGGGNLGDGGAHSYLGLIPNWDAAYLCSGSTVNAYKAVVMNAYRHGRYGVHMRDESTNRPVRFDDPVRVQLAITDSDGTWKYGAYGTLGDVTIGGSGGAPPVYSPAHQPSPGFFAYLVTGRYYMLEELQLTCGAQFLHRGWFRNGADGRIDSKYLQVRESAWSLRTLFQCTSATPDSDALRAGYVASVQKNAEFQHAIFLDQPNHPFGIPVSGTGSGPPGAQGFEMDFWVASWLHGVLLQPLTGTAKATLERYASYTAKCVINRLGGTGPAEYLYADATGYYRPNGTGIALFNPQTTVTGFPPDGVTTGAGPFNNTWGEIYRQMHGVNNPGTNDALQGEITDPGGGWGSIHLAASMCVTLGLPGAAEAFARLTGANNYSTWTSNVTFYRFVNFAGTPVTALPNANKTTPSWLSAIPVGEWGALSNSVLSQSSSMVTGGDEVLGFYSGGIINTRGVYDGATFVPGTFFVAWGVGHTIGTTNMYAFGPMEGTPTWRRLRNSITPQPTNIEADGSGNPVSVHTYNNPVYLGEKRNQWFAPGGLYRYSDAGLDSRGRTYSFNTASPNTNQPWTQKAAIPGGSAPSYASVYDWTRDKVFYWPASRDAIGLYDPVADTHSVVFGKNFQINSDRLSAAFDSTRGIFAMLGDALAFYRTNNGTANSYYSPTVTGGGPTLGVYGSLLYDKAGDYFVSKMNTGRKLWKLTPPASNPYQGGNPWVWSEIVPTTGATPQATDGSFGVFGRFSYIEVPGGRGYLYIPYVAASPGTSPVYFYRAA